MRATVVASDATRKQANPAESEQGIVGKPRYCAVINIS